MCDHKYITPAGEEALKVFKYKGGSDSLLYEYLWSPLSEYLVTAIIPSWVAPNLITFTGFTAVCMALYFIQINSWDFQTDLPPWTLFLGGFAVLFYQVLDNVDGKQARKTGSSSPLGMLFDHGCDTTTTWVIGLMIANCIQIGSTYMMMFGMLWMAFLGFFFGMWSQYHIGYMRLSRINAIDEGLVIVELIFFVSGVFGQGIWSYPVMGMQLNELVIVVCSTIAFFQCADFFKSVIFEKSLYAAVSTLGLPLFIISVFAITSFYSPSDAVLHYGYLYLYGYGFMWSKMVGHMQLAHIVNEKFDQFKPTWVFACAIQIVNVMTGYWFGGKCIMNEKLLAYLILILGFVCYSHFCIQVALQISTVLQIGIFTIKKRKDESPQQHLQGTESFEIEFQEKV